jgi:hypothetical protein
MMMGINGLKLLFSLSRAGRLSGKISPRNAVRCFDLFLNETEHELQAEVRAEIQARVTESVYVADLKSAARKGLGVQVPSLAP